MQALQDTAVWHTCLTVPAVGERLGEQVSRLLVQWHCCSALQGGLTYMPARPIEGLMTAGGRVGGGGGVTAASLQQWLDRAGT